MLILDNLKIRKLSQRIKEWNRNQFQKMAGKR